MTSENRSGVGMLLADDFANNNAASGGESSGKGDDYRIFDSALSSKLLNEQTVDDEQDDQSRMEHRKDSESPSSCTATGGNDGGCGSVDSQTMVCRGPKRSQFSEQILLKFGLRYDEDLFGSEERLEEQANDGADCKLPQELTHPQDEDDEEDEDEGHVDDGSSSLGSSITCSEDSFEIATSDSRHLSGRRSIFDDQLLTGQGDSGTADVSGSENNDDSPVCQTPPSQPHSSIEHEWNEATIEERLAAVVEEDGEPPQRDYADLTDSPNANFTSSCSFTRSKQRISIDDELSSLDTGLPQLDFEKLEKQLMDASKEREMNQRKLMSEQVRLKLASETLDQPSYHPPPATKRPLRSNLGARLQSGRNLQICYMNDADVGKSAEVDDLDEEEWTCVVPKSFSTPSFSESGSIKKALGRSVSNCGDSEKRASELRRAMLDQLLSEDKDFGKRQARLERETKMMFQKAREVARLQMEMERQTKTKAAEAEKMVLKAGITNATKKLTRSQLTKMTVTQLQIILNGMHSRIEALNEELVHLLIERDNQHMEQDSLLVDIEDLLQHSRCKDLPMPDFLADSTLNVASNNNNNSKHVRFRIFRR